MRGGGVISVTLNTGAPQGCFLSPVLFSLYTNEMQIKNPFCQLYKYADDMVLLGLMKVGDTTSQTMYFDHIAELTGWCRDSCLYINTAKTKELVIVGHQRIDVDLPPAMIDNQQVEVVQEFKYLGTFFDCNLSFTFNTEHIFKKAMQRLHLIRELNSFYVGKNILDLVYQGLVESVLCYNICTWYGHLGVKNRAKLAKIVKMASKIIGREQKQLGCIYDDGVEWKAHRILADPSHPLASEFQKLPSGRRYRAAKTTKNIYKKSFIPNAITILNL